MRLLVVSCAPVVSSFTLSLACLLLTAITVHDTCSYDGSFPLHPLVILQSSPSCACVPLSLFLLSSTHSRTQWHFSSDHVSVCVFTLPTCQRCFDVFSCRPTPLVSVRPLVWWVNSGGTWHLAPVEMTCQMSHLINISFFSFFFFHCFFLSLIVFPPSPRWEHSTSAPPPAALVHPCSGGTWGPSGSQGLRDGSLHPPSSHVRPLRAISRGQSNKPIGARRRPGDDRTASLCRWPQADND